MNSKDKYYLIFFIIFIYILNMGHIAQQDVYNLYYLPLAKSISNHSTYSINGVSYSYPMWGYSILMSICNIFAQYSAILLFQLILCFFSIQSFYKIFELKFRKYHFVLLLPFVALCTVKWNDAIVASLIIIYIDLLLKSLKSNTLKDIIFSGVVLGVILNFRSEYLLLIPLQIIILFSFKSVRANVSFIRHCVLYLTTFMVLLPWGIRNYIEFDNFKLTSSNGASVMYISLGQLEDNIWNIKAKDESAFAFVKKKGIKDPYSIKGEEILKDEFYKNISNNPIEYLKKMLSNSLDFVIGGVYTGEYGSIFIPKTDRIRIDNSINKANGAAKFDVIMKQSMQSKYPIIFEKLILVLYRLIWATILILFLYTLYRQKWDYISLIVLAFFIHKLIIVSGIQYEYRHINSIYLLILGIVLKRIPQKV